MYKYVLVELMFNVVDWLTLSFSFTLLKPLVLIHLQSRDKISLRTLTKWKQIDMGHYSCKSHVVDYTKKLRIWQVLTFSLQTYKLIGAALTSVKATIVHSLTVREPFVKLCCPNGFLVVSLMSAWCSKSNVQNVVP